jgi:hypothetical protein
MAKRLATKFRFGKRLGMKFRLAMKFRFGMKLALVACLALHVAAIVAANDLQALELEPSQLITPANMTPVELDYYNKATDPSVKKNFIATRSYVRLAQKVVDKTMPAEQLPNKPAGFSVQYLLPDEPTVINQAIGLSVAKLLEICMRTKGPACR